MIMAILLIAVGLLLAAAAILLRKKISGTWMRSLCATGVVVLAFGASVLGVRLSENAQASRNTYLGLRYLENMNLGSASFYLNKTGTEDVFSASAGRYLIAKMQNNEFIADLNLRTSNSLAKGKKQEQMAQALMGIPVEDPEKLAGSIQRLCGLLKLSDKKQQELDRYMEAESGGAFGGAMAELSKSEQETRLRMEVSASLKNANPSSAVRTAARLADEYPAARNRLLLANSIAELTYAGQAAEPEAFQTHRPEEEQPSQDKSIEKEQKAIQADVELLAEQITTLDAKTQQAAEEERQDLESKKQQLEAQQLELNKKLQHIYVYRAFNSIADIHTVEAEIVRARLYFAMQDYDQAMDRLLSAANAPSVKLMPRRPLASSLSTIRKACRGDSQIYESAGFKNTVEQVLSAPFEDLMGLSQTPLTEDFANRVANDQKQYLNGLELYRLDSSAFPEIDAYLNGREDLLEQIADGQGVISRDTGKEITCTAQFEKGGANNICIVADCSGSMGGEPLRMLKQAIEDFVKSKKANAKVSIVAFADSGRVVTPLTSDVNQLVSGAQSLGVEGGTDIGAGIQTGLEELEGAAGSNTILLMSDGESSLDFSILHEAQEKKVSIYTVGFGSVNDNLMENIAVNTGGKYIKADELSELVNIFASIQGVAGNVLKLHYTVENPEEVPMRYLFLKVGEHSLRRDYVVESETPQPMVYSCVPGILDLEQQIQTAEYGQTNVFRLTGRMMSGVSAVEIGGTAMEIKEKNGTDLVVEGAPFATAGWKDIKLDFEDGTSQTWSQFILVDQVQRVNSIRVGNLVFESVDVIRLGNGKLAAGDSWNGITQLVNAGAEPGNGLQAELTGIAILPAAPAGEDGTLPADLDYGDTGEITGRGRICPTRSDAAMTMDTPYESVSGLFHISCRNNEVILTNAHEGSEWTNAIG